MTLIQIRGLLIAGLLNFLSNNESLNKYIKNAKLSFRDYPELPRKLYNQMLQWEEYLSYMANEESSFNEDRRFVGKLITELIASSEDLHLLLEEMSIYWNDDLEFVSIMLEKTIRGFKEDSGPDYRFMPLFKNTEDESFVKKLLSKTILNSSKYIDLIDKKTTNWEIDRVALMDTLVMQLAISEIVEFDEIPVKVTLNEYIEIAKYYCTAKSGTFVNGILDEIVKEMRSEKLFVKKGRGLVGEPGYDKN